MIGQLKANRAAQRIDFSIDTGAVLGTTITSARIYVVPIDADGGQTEWLSVAVVSSTSNRVVLRYITDGTESGTLLWNAKLYVSGTLVAETAEDPDKPDPIVFTPSRFT